MSSTMSDDDGEDFVEGFNAAMDANREPAKPEGRRRGRGGRRPAGPITGPAFDAPDNPLRPLGHIGEDLVLFDCAGQFRRIDATRLARRPVMLKLLGADLGWALRHFAAIGADGVATGGLNADALYLWIVRGCTEAGIFDVEEPVRLLGVWRAGGVVMAHFGDVVWLPATGEARPAGFRAHGALWPATRRILPRHEDGAPLPPPAPAALAHRVEALFGRWHWEQDHAPRVVCGLWAAGLLGAASRWRPHGLVAGSWGNGKTTLFNTIQALSPLALGVANYSESGLRQRLNGSAAPLLLDEAEGDPESAARLNAAIRELLRNASGGKGAVTLRGSAGGQHQTYEVVCQALLGAILPPVLPPQDASRFTRVDLLPPPADAGDRPPLPDDAMLEQLRGLAPSLLARALAGAARFAANVMAYRAEILRRGCAPRLADQVGTILAARAMMLHDDPASAEEVWEDCNAHALLLPAAEDAAEEDGPGAALVHLLQSRASATRGGERPTFGVLIAKAQTHWGHDERRILREHGIGIGPWPAEGCPPHLFIANSHPALAEVYAGTRWADRRWREDLRRMPGACCPPGPRREAGPTKPRCTVLPMPVEPWADGDSQGGGAAGGEGGTM